MESIIDGRTLEKAVLPRTHDALKKALDSSWDVYMHFFMKARNNAIMPRILVQRDLFERFKQFPIRHEFGE